MRKFIRDNIYNEYVGQFKDDLKNGKGFFRWGESGNSYEGEFVNDLREGWGEF